MNADHRHSAARDPLAEADLRSLLRESLHEPRGSESGPLQERVMAQWHQRHARNGATAVADLALAGGGAGHRPHHGLRPPLWLGLAGVLLALALALTWSVNRPDPALEELMQPDVLSQIGLGEI
ncbi:hypothetical protein [Hydrogenophaga sp.]|uniref:hypothetical protein n=1 Tax=Hydrogenophaga sp. TaxID=1904254 RepID=UPI00262682CD|nr:hypothetical protein [Hydrogenophaga sp.]MCW5655381.1 hypothetical protein [Hydrogenophaga sp.]